MANNCAFTAKVTGPNHEAALEFAQDFESYGRIYFADVQDDWDDDKSIEIYGDCAWSIESSLWPMRQDCFGGSTDSKFMDKAEELGITLEMYAEEIGMGFMEHYLIENGVLTLSEECNYGTFDLYDEKPTQEELEDLACEWSYSNVEEMLGYAEDGYLMLGGYEYDFDFKPAKPRGNTQNRVLIDRLSEVA